MKDELRRIERIAVCCRAVVRDRYGVWTGVTEDVHARGCRIVTPRLLRPGTLLSLSLASDLFPEELDVMGEVVWATDERLAIEFVGSVARQGRLSPEAWIAKVVEHGAIESRTHIVPTVRAVERVLTALPSPSSPPLPRITASRAGASRR
jgi:hypothetical protein